LRFGDELGVTQTDDDLNSAVIELILTIAAGAAFFGYFLYAVVHALLCIRNERREWRQYCRMAPMVKRRRP